MQSNRRNVFLAALAIALFPPPMLGLRTVGIWSRTRTSSRQGPTRLPAQFGARRRLLPEIRRDRVRVLVHGSRPRLGDRLERRRQA